MIDTKEYTDSGFEFGMEWPDAWEPALVEEGEPPAETPQSVEEYLDNADLNRMEYDRINTDLYPNPGAAPEDESRAPRVHKDTDKIQQWLREQRARNA